MISVIVPAYNEEAVIARCLRAMVTGAQPGELEIIVACNGCTDRTAEIARSFGPPVRVIEIPQASKVAALNAADEAATGFPRFYVDADVIVDLASLRAMAAVLERGEALLVAPKLRMDLSKTTWPVRAYYRVWMSLPYNQVMVGTGAYGLSRAGRARFGRFPDLIADDGFVRFSFRPEERVRVDEATSWVEPPRSLAGLVRIKTRSRLGFYQHRRAQPDRRVGDRKPLGQMLRMWLMRPSLWPALPCYAAVTLIVRLRATRHLNVRGGTSWERDDAR